MAQKVVVSLVDDLTGDEAEETVQFGLDGKNYEMDLSEKNAEKLRDILGTYVAAGRHVSKSRGNGGMSAAKLRQTATAPKGIATGEQKLQNQAIREWARKRGFQVSDRGRIPADIVANYHNENG